jgi:hypothetical protein
MLRASLSMEAAERQMPPGPTALRRRWLLAAAACLLLDIAGCAHPAATASSAIAPIPPGKARIWFYRDYEPYAGRGRPAIAANGGYVGLAELGGAFYRDVAPGPYHISVETTGVDFNQTSDLDLAAGQEAYIKIVSNPSWVSGGLSQYERPTFYAWRIPNAVAQADVSRLDIYGGG